MGKTKRGKGTKIMTITDAGGVVLSILVQSANPHKVTLVDKTLEERFVDELPEKLIGDRAYGSDPLDEQLSARGVEMIAPHKATGAKTKPGTDANCGRTKEGGGGALLFLAIQLQTLCLQI